MTDNEIIKAFMCCDFECSCFECPKSVPNKGCDGVSEEILDLINRQKAEIEKLQSDNSSMQSTLAKMSMGVEQAKAEAIKEFAERLKGIYINDKRYDRPNAHTLIDWLFNNIDNLIKEMVGDVNNVPTKPKKFVFEIEHFYGDRYMAFEVTLLENGTLDISRTEDCDHADTEDDYIFESGNLLYRVISNIKELG